MAPADAPLRLAVTRQQKLAHGGRLTERIALAVELGAGVGALPHRTGERRERAERDALGPPGGTSEECPGNKEVVERQHVLEPAADLPLLVDLTTLGEGEVGLEIPLDAAGELGQRLV